ncbi:amino acid permease [Venturia nashicola]|nr:amino acid permease [Venturia nashicola]
MAAIAQSDVTEKAAFDPEYQLRASDGSGSDLPRYNGRATAEKHQELSFWTRNGCTIESFKRRTVDDSHNQLNQTMKPRHLHMIAIAGSIEAGLFFASGSALANGGPGALLLDFGIIGIMMFNVVYALGELAVMYPVSGGFYTYSTRFVDPSWGFAMGWNYDANPQSGILSQKRSQKDDRIMIIATTSGFASVDRVTVLHFFSSNRSWNPPQLRDLQYVLGSSTLHTDSELTIYSLYNRAAQLSDYRRPTTRKVALVGDAGVGKSSLINSLLDVQNLARTSANGVACTCAAFKAQLRVSDPFLIEWVEDNALERLMAWTAENVTEGSASLAERHILSMSLHALQKSSRLQEFELQSFLMVTCNDHVTHTLRAQYLPMALNCNLKIFCVSNTLYWRDRRRPLEVAQAPLALSGLSRSESIAFPLSLRVSSKQAAISCARRYRLFLALSTFEVVDAMERGLATTNAMKLVGPTSRSSALVRTMRHNFEERVVQVMATYSAFCRRYRDYFTPAVGSHCWNDEAIAAMSSSMEIPWDSFLKLLDSTREETLNHIEDLFRRAETTASQVAIPVDIQRTLLEALPNHENQLLSDLTRLYDELDQDLGSLWTDGLSGIRTSIIGQLAEDSYRESMGESGTGSDARRKAIIRRCFADRTLFASIGRELKRKLADLARDFQSKVIAAFVNRIAIIQENLNTLRNGNAMEEADDHPAFRGRVERALAEKLREMGRITMDIMDVE